MNEVLNKAHNEGMGFICFYQFELGVYEKSLLNSGIWKTTTTSQSFLYASVICKTTNTKRL